MAGGAGPFCSDGETGGWDPHQLRGEGAPMAGGGPLAGMVYARCKGYARLFVSI